MNPTTKDVLEIAIDKLRTELTDVEGRNDADMVSAQEANYLPHYAKQIKLEIQELCDDYVFLINYKGVKQNGKM